ncbi:hypothetical protein ACFT9I_27205 [Streptomyces sp. NPDC057137]|uniref:hypothetical protein n=1 Tax=Streptomyces sp. NPDC057137 TaxID=3346030 RepID=UPI0036389BAE
MSNEFDLFGQSPANATHFMQLVQSGAPTATIVDLALPGRDVATSTTDPRETVERYRSEGHAELADTLGTFLSEAGLTTNNG